MKKLLLLLAAMVLSFTLASCGTETDPDPDPEGSAPVITGITEGGSIVVKVGEALDVSGITAVDSDGNTLTVRVTGA